MYFRSSPPGAPVALAKINNLVIAPALSYSISLPTLIIDDPITGTDQLLSLPVIIGSAVSAVFVIGLISFLIVRSRNRRYQTPPTYDENSDNINTNHRSVSQPENANGMNGSEVQSRGRRSGRHSRRREPTAPNLADITLPLYAEDAPPLYVSNVNLSEND